MIIAWDKDNIRTHIADTKSNQEYYCPYCGAPLTVKKGDIRKHHFAHKIGHLCRDEWERNGIYDKSEWHYNWQDQFPLENQEISLTLGSTKHRADVVIDRTVIEFQHSILRKEDFDNRNNFYFNLGYKVVWLFDVEDLIEDGKITYSLDEKNLLNVKWKNPKKAFNPYDVEEGKIDLFLQFYDFNKEKKIVRVINVSSNGFEEFTTTNLMSKEEFFNYIGFIDGNCIAPNRMDLDENEEYKQFKVKYGIILNKQQERAMIAVEGNNLLLAVPGSGKTTVLVDRLGYMIFEKHINPKDILCITFNVEAKDEMKRRFIEKFGIENSGIEFSTINAISLKIYNDYCDSKNISKKTTDKKESKKIAREILKEANDYVTNDDVEQFINYISYAKNMMLDEDGLKCIDECMNLFTENYKKYCKQLESKKIMDFDDQMVFAYEKLESDCELAKKWRTKYKYICVDEAQDTSKIQHAIINILAKENNLFMVGDEDQTIYGFRGAYPLALLNFRTDYINPYILKMETNYRSTQAIVDVANKFINRNKGRYEKNMIANKGIGSPVELVKVESTNEQFYKCVDIAKNGKEQIAFLYRDNTSCVVLLDLFLKNNIKFCLKKPEHNFFNEKKVKGLIACLKIAINSEKYADEIYNLNKPYIHMQYNTKKFVVKNSRHIGFYNALKEQMKYVKRCYVADAENLENTLNSIKKLTPYKAISSLIDAYNDDVTSCEVSILLELSRNISTLNEFIERVEYLSQVINEGVMNDDKRIALSTVHTSKGKEFDSVYLIDVYDGRFPTSNRNYFNGSKDYNDNEQSERRLFYVALTRAKTNLSIFKIKDKKSSYIEELFPSEKKEIDRKAIPENYKYYRRELINNNIMSTEQLRNDNRFAKPMIVNNQEKNEIENNINEKELYERHKKEALEKVKKNEEAFDSSGKRWVMCKSCGMFDVSDKFSSYGGEGPNTNSGVCLECEKRAREEKKKLNKVEK